MLLSEWQLGGPAVTSARFSAQLYSIISLPADPTDQATRVPDDCGVMEAPPAP